VALVEDVGHCGERPELFGLGQLWDYCVQVHLDALLLYSRAFVEVETAVEPLVDKGLVAGNRSSVGVFPGQELQFSILGVLLLPFLFLLLVPKILLGRVVALVGVWELHLRSRDRQRPTLALLSASPHIEINLLLLGPLEVQPAFTNCLKNLFSLYFFNLRRHELLFARQRGHHRKGVIPAIVHLIVGIGDSPRCDLPLADALDKIQLRVSEHDLAVV
jgi:hypothetical protein